MESPFPLEPQYLSSPTSAIACVFLVIYAVHLILVHFDVPMLSLHELVWNVVVYSIPAPLLLSSTERLNLRAKGMAAQVHAAKSEALRQVFETGGRAVLQQSLSETETVATDTGKYWSRVVGLSSGTVTSDAPAGLGNWDNSCYQNSVLQALTALDTLPLWLGFEQGKNEDESVTTRQALYSTVNKLRDRTNNGKRLWTPAKLKNMSSWQQQDAQEYFSKVMDELDKEATKTARTEMLRVGLESLSWDTKKTHDMSTESDVASLRNPLEGLIAQRITCTSCDFSEGYSMIPFNCLTVPLGPLSQYDLAECLTEHSKLEAITGVECRRCTLLRAEEKIKVIAATKPKRPDNLPEGSNDGMLDLPPEIRAQIAQRLHSIQTALSEDDYSDKTLKQDCQIPAKSYVSSTKTREALIGRAPQALVVHVNRSVFDEMTGMQRKNYAHVRYPLVLNLKPWVLGIGDLAADYRLRAVVTHQGRHENGHYICYRQHPTAGIPESESTTDQDDESNIVIKNKPNSQWWRLSDEDVSLTTEQDALDQGGVFMLFYERDVDHVYSSSSGEQVPQITTESLVETNGTSTDVLENTIATPDDMLEMSENAPSLVSIESPLVIPSSSQSITSDSRTDIEIGYLKDFEISGNKLPQAPIMRTALPSTVRHDISFSRSMMSC